jgi:hypothetical protein
MNQREAVDTMFRLLPQMENDTPENVFVKYAADKRLSPAQLTRLGQVFNTTSTNVTLQKDRNGTPSLIDVPAMVGSYVNSTGRSPKHAHQSFLSEEAAPPQEKAASATTGYSFSRGHVPDVWNGGRPGIEHQKVARAAPKPDVRAAGRDAIALVTLALEEYGNKSADYHAEIRKIAQEFTIDREKVLDKFATFANDLPGFLNSQMETEAVIGSLGSRLKAAGVDIPVEDGGKRIREKVILYRDRTGQVQKAAAAIECLKEATAARLAISDGMLFLKEHEDELRKDPLLDRQLNKIATQVENHGTVLGLFKDASPERAPAVDATAAGIERASKGLDDALVSRPPKFEDYDKDDNMRDLRYGDAATNAARFVGLQAQKGFSRGNKAVLEDIPRMVDEFTEEGRLGKMLRFTVGDNKKRVGDIAVDREQIARDTRAAATLQKLMIKDEVLSTRDPEQVWQAFQSIRSASPHVAGDETMLKLLLRQATEIGGLDIDTGGAIRKYDDPKVRPGSKIYDKLDKSERSEPSR